MFIHFSVRKKMDMCNPLILQGSLWKNYSKELIDLLKSKYPKTEYDIEFWKENIVTEKLDI